MKLFILISPKHLEQGQSLLTYLTEKNLDCTLYKSQTQFFRELTENPSMPDLIAFDYSLFNHTIFNLYEHLERNNFLMPAIFFNDPGYSEINRIIYWQSILNLVYFKRISEKEKYIQAFEILNGALDLYDFPELKNNTFNIEEKNIDSDITKKSESNIYTGNIESKLTSSSLIIFHELKKNINSRVEIEDLKQKIQRGKKAVQDSTIFCAISKIRNVLKAENINELQIIKNCSGYRLLELEKRADK